MPLLEIEGLHVRRGSAPNAYHVELPRLHLNKGEVVAITGESGCGKSTLLESIGLLLAPWRLQRYHLGAAGSIKALLEERDERRLAAIRSRHLGFVLQNGGLLPYLSVKDNIALSRRLIGQQTSSPQEQEAIETLGLSGRMDAKPQALSIGERQRVAFVRAIAHGPSLLLADEPTAALDPGRANDLFRLILDLVCSMNIAALIVSHDWQLVNRFGLRRLHAQPRGDTPQTPTRFTEDTVT
ncbi:ABC transporter ATP-binding protein [Castellaniella sp.]|uniref:ABC transporter ATP-binding protein n=1 Tax=Castellaniella sp. TaxID=1955812 RepID=UPI002AFE705F|nr:ATP-binding cassette domain-containing protein [Castellaniella sp.]